MPRVPCFNEWCDRLGRYAKLMSAVGSVSLKYKIILKASLAVKEAHCELDDSDRTGRADGGGWCHARRCWRTCRPRRQARQRRLYVAVPRGSCPWRGRAFAARAAMASAGAYRAYRIGAWRLSVLRRYCAAHLYRPPSISNGGPNWWHDPDRCLAWARCRCDHRFNAELNVT